MRVLGIDYGDARIGLALSDVSGFLAGGIGKLDISGMNDALKKIAPVIEENEIDTVVIGLPLNMDGTCGASASKIKVFAGKLSEKFPNIKIEFIDERRTTILASEYMNITGTHGKSRKNKIDTLSAQIILQTYLDLQKNKEK
jgi:putative Holliday junction resolvase